MVANRYGRQSREVWDNNDPPWRRSCPAPTPSISVHLPDQQKVGTRSDIPGCSKAEDQALLKNSRPGAVRRRQNFETSDIRASFQRDSKFDTTRTQATKDTASSQDASSQDTTADDTTTRAAAGVLRVPPPPPPPGRKGPAEQSSGTSTSPEATDHGAAAKRQRTRKPPTLPLGDLRFHPYQEPKRGQEFLGCRICICDRCGWVAKYNTQILPWQGAFAHKHDAYTFFRQELQEYSCAAMQQYWEGGFLDATWYCLWCLVKTDVRGRSEQQICYAYNLYSETAKQRTRTYRLQNDSRPGPSSNRRYKNLPLHRRGHVDMAARQCYSRHLKASPPSSSSNRRCKNFSLQRHKRPNMRTCQGNSS